MMECRNLGFKVLALGAAGVVSVRSGWSCPMPDTDSSNHCRAQLSPAVRTVVLQGKCKKGKNTA